MKYRVLIVEANTDFLGHLTSIFDEVLGYDVTQVDNAREAQRLLYQSRQPHYNRFDLIVTNMNLEVDTGDKLSKKDGPSISLGGLQVLESLKQIHEDEICVILSGQTLPMREVRSISKDYSDIVFDIIDTGDNVYSAIIDKIHPAVIRNSMCLFLSYRLQDSSLFTDRIYESLLNNFNSKRIFRNLDLIGAGVNFRDSIRTTITQSNAILVVIGTEWVTVTGDKGQLLLFDPRDYVRFDVEEALRQNKFIIPVLLDSANMPSPDQFPVDIVPLAYKNAIHIRQGVDFANDMERLMLEIDKSLDAI